MAEKTNRPITISLEQLQEQELALEADEEGDYSDLAAEQELDFESVQEREYQPEVWEVLNDDETNGEDTSS